MLNVSDNLCPEIFGWCKVYESNIKIGTGTAVEP